MSVKQDKCIEPLLAPPQVMAMDNAGYSIAPACDGLLFPFAENGGLAYTPGDYSALLGMVLDATQGNGQALWALHYGESHTDCTNTTPPSTTTTAQPPPMRRPVTRTRCAPGWMWKGAFEGVGEVDSHALASMVAADQAAEVDAVVIWGLRVRLPFASIFSRLLFIHVA